MNGPAHYNVSAPEPTAEEEREQEQLMDQTTAVMENLGLPEQYRDVVADLLGSWHPEDIDHEKVETMYEIHAREY